MPNFQAKRFCEALNGLDFELRLTATLQFLVKLEVESNDFRHLLLRQISAQSKITKILGKS